METKLNMLSLMRWEALRRKPFACMDWQDEDDTEALLYVVYGLPGGADFDTFRSTASAVKLRRRWLSEITREFALQSQAMPPLPKEDKADGGTGKPAYLTDKVPQLIALGLDATYALYRMTLPELYIMGEAFAAREHDRLEWQRYWTYCTMMPHCTSDALKDGPRILGRFAWEVEEARTITQKEIRMFEAFMASAKPRTEKQKPEP